MVLACLSPSLSAEVLVEVVEHGGPTLEPGLVIPVAHGDARDQPVDAGRLGATELPVFQIDVVDDLGDGTHRRIVYPEPGEQDLEGAEIALVRELGLEHVEAELAALGTVSLARYEFEPRLRVNDAPDQPGARHPIDVDALPSDPRAATKILHDLPVVRLAGSVEERLHPVVLQTFDEARFADRGIAAALDDLAQEPLEVLLRLVGLRHDVHGVLDRHRTHRLQPSPDLHPK